MPGTSASTAPTRGLLAILAALGAVLLLAGAAGATVCPHLTADGGAQATHMTHNAGGSTAGPAAKPSGPGASPADSLAWCVTSAACCSTHCAAPTVKPVTAPTAPTPVPPPVALPQPQEATPPAAAAASGSTPVPPWTHLTLEQLTILRL